MSLKSPARTMIALSLLLMFAFTASTVAAASGTQAAAGPVPPRASSVALSFFALAPCRVYDTRTAPGGALQRDVRRTIAVSGVCGVPATANALVVNVTAINPADIGLVSLIPADDPTPVAPILTFVPGKTRSNNGLVRLAANGSLDALLYTASPGGTLDFTLDITGYYGVGAPLAVDDSYVAAFQTALPVAAPGVLGNDTVNGAAILSYGATTGSEQTTIGSATPTSQAGSVTLNADGSLNYTPPTGFRGDDTFKYVIQNSVGASTAMVTFAVGKADQTISYTSTAPAAAKVGGATYNVTATATSGLTVAFTIDATAASVCTISGSTVSFIGAGTCVIDADQAGDTNYNAAPQVQQSFAVAKGDQTISFTSTAPVAAKVGGATYTVTATATSGLAVTFTIDATATSVCSISGSTVSFLSVGTCVLDADQAGDANWNAAPQAQQSFAVGKGDQTITFTSTAPAAASVGGPTYTVTATATSGLTVAFTIDATATAVCSISGSTVSFQAAGTCVIDANQAGDSNWNAAPQAQQSFAVGKSAQTISFTSTAPVAAKVGGATYTVTATATSGLTVALTIDATAASVCTISGSTVSFIGAGTCVIDANQPGDSNYNPAPQVQQSFLVAKGDQTISFTSAAPVAAKVGGATYTVTATATSGLAVTFTIDATATSVCSISGSTVSFLSVGTCVIDANQPGDANWNAAPQAQQSFAVAKGDQTISFTSTAPVAAKVGGATYTVTATATSGLAVTFTIDASATSVCSISGSTVSFIGAGTCVIDANQAGNANWNAAPQVQQSFAVAKGDQTITFTSTAPVGAVVNGPTYTVTATATSGLAVTFTIDASATSVCSISGSTVSFLAAGTCVIDANQAGNANWNAAPQVQQSFTVSKANQTISFTSTAPVAAKVGGATYTVTATATSGLTVTFTIDASATSVCSIAGSTVSFIGVGTCVIDANQAGNGAFNAAPQVQQSFLVGKGDQTISFTSAAPVAAKVGGPTYTVTATATSGLAVTFTIDASATSVCSISGSTVSFLSVGTCVIDANQAGNANWNAAPQAQQSFVVNKGDQTISYTSTAPVAAKVGGATYTVTATATSGLAVTFTIDASATSVCSISGSTVSFIGAGTCVIDANQAGNANFNAAPQAQQSFAVAKGDQTITFTSTAPAAVFGGPTYTVTATATSGLAVTFTIDASATSVCSISGSTVSFIGAGTCVIDANQPGDTNWNAAPQVQQSFAVAKASQTINFTSTAPTAATPGGPTYTVTATATSGLAVTFTIDASATSVCSISGSTVSFLAGGTCVIDANQAGNANYNAAPQVQQSFHVNFPPAPIPSPKESFETVGNVQFEFKAAQTLPIGLFVSGNLVANFTDGDGPSPVSAVPVVAGSTANGGKVDIAANGEFTFTPKTGDLAATDSFGYQVTDGLAIVNRTVTITFKSRAWFVKNNAPAGGSGRSHEPFNTLAAAQAASLAGDYIFVHGGDLTNTGQTAGFTLKANQKLYGEAVGLTIANTVNGTANPTLVAANVANRPVIDNTAANSDGITALNISGVEIRGISVSGTQDAIDLTTNGANSGGAVITDNVIRLPGIDGIHVAAGGTGAVTLAIQNNTITGNMRGMELLKTAGTMTITAFDNNVVDGATPGSGIVIDGAIFDAVPGNPITTVFGGKTAIGASGNGVGASGMLLTNVTGDLSFNTDLDIVNDFGTGLLVSSTGAVNVGAGTGFRLTVASGVGSIDSNGGPAVSVSNASINLPALTNLRSTGSTTTGISLVNAFGGVGATTLSASTGLVTDPGGASGTAVNISGGNGDVILGIPITNTSGNSIVVASRTSDTVSFSNTVSDTGSGISLTSNGGATINFTGALTVSTGANPAFTATGGGTVSSTDTTSTLTTTTGTALNVANTNIGASGLKFRSISANGAASGIILNTTGASGSLTVLGTGSAGSGGTIQNTTSHAVSLASTLSPSFNNLTISNSVGSGVKGTTVTNFTFTNGSIDNSGTGGGTDESNIAFNTSAAGTETNLSGTVTITGNSLTNSRYHGVDILNFNGTVSNLTISSNTITSSTLAASSLGTGIRLQGLGSATGAAVLTQATLGSNTISNFPTGSGILVNCGNSNAAGPGGSCGTPSTANKVSITGNTIKGQSSANQIGSNAIAVAVTGGNGGSRSQANFDISSNGTVANPVTNFKGTGVGCTVLGMSTATCNVANNVMVANNIVASRCISVGADRLVAASDTPDITATITGNSVSACDGNDIFTGALNSNGTAKVKVQNNTLAAPLSGNRAAIQVNSGTPSAAGTNTTVCLNISGNTGAGSGVSTGIGLRKEGTVSTTNAFGVNGMAATASPGVESYVDGLNPAGGGTTLTSAVSGFTNCSLP